MTDKHHTVEYRCRTVAQAWAGSDGKSWTRRYRYKWQAKLAAWWFRAKGAGDIYETAFYVGMLP